MLNVVKFDKAHVQYLLKFKKNVGILNTHI